jgi:hypothetical protein
MVFTRLVRKDQPAASARKNSISNESHSSMPKRRFRPTTAPCHNGHPVPNPHPSRQKKYVRAGMTASAKVWSCSALQVDRVQKLQQRRNIDSESFAALYEHVHVYSKQGLGLRYKRWWLDRPDRRLDHRRTEADGLTVRF